MHEFYANTSSIVSRTKVTKVRNQKVKFDKKMLNDYLGLDNLEPMEYLVKLAKKDIARPWIV